MGRKINKKSNIFGYVVLCKYLWRIFNEESSAIFFSNSNFSKQRPKTLPSRQKVPFDTHRHSDSESQNSWQLTLICCFITLLIAFSLLLVAPTFSSTIPEPIQSISVSIKVLPDSSAGEALAESVISKVFRAFNFFQSSKFWIKGIRISDQNWCARVYFCDRRISRMFSLVQPIN